MLNITKNSIIYVICPSDIKTGGTELAHQLVYQINRLGLQAKIAYFNSGKNSTKINKAFKCYVDNFVNLTDIKDVSDNIIIIPEGYPLFLKNYCKSQKCIWWMSVDNFCREYNFINS